MIKIDKSFVDHLGLDRDESSMAKVIVAIGQTLGLEVVAEGVEGVRSRSTSLRALDCDKVQGFHLGRPMSDRTRSSWPAVRPGPSNSRQRWFDSASDGREVRGPADGLVETVEQLLVAALVKRLHPVVRPGGPVAGFDQESRSAAALSMPAPVHGSW